MNKLEAYGRIAKEHDKIANKYDKFYSSKLCVAENKAIAFLINKEIKPSGKILDLGCGTGLLLELFKIPKRSYLGLDISDKMLEIARKKHSGYQFQKMNFDRLGLNGFAPRSFDCAISLFGSLSYSLDIKSCLSGIDTVVKGKQFLMFMTKKRKGKPQSKALFKTYSENQLRKLCPSAEIYGFSFFAKEYKQYSIKQFAICLQREPSFWSKYLIKEASYLVVIKNGHA